MNKLNNMPLEISQLAIAIEILKTYNCRASEVLSAEWKSFVPNKLLAIRGKKHSANIIVRDRFILDLVEQLPRIHSTLIFSSISYNHLYRHCKQYYSHLFIKFKKRKNFKVTHGFRYENVSQFANEEIIRDILHHRSISSGKYYK